jgi:presenilin-like A22 family membrane protease
MKNLNSFLIIIGIYLSIQAVGIYVGYGLIGFFDANPEYTTFENPDDPAVSGQMFLYIIAMTAVLLLLIKYKLDIFIKILMAIAALSGLTITFQSFVGRTFAIIPALVLFALNLKIGNLLLRNTTLVLVISGIGAYLGANLGVIPCLIFLILLSVYDVIAVFGTKHMITLADEGKGRFPFMFTIPLGKGEMEIGTGDFVIPLMFSVSLLADYNIKFALISAFGGLIGALALFFYALRTEHQALPALPPIAAGLIIGFGIALMIF